MDAFEPYWQHVGPDTIFIGHSVGAVFALRIIEKATEPIAGTILLAPFVSAVAHQGINLVTATFINDDLSWKQIHDKAGNVLIFYGQGDPYIDYEESKEVANLLGTDLNKLEGAGHFDAASGVLATPFLVEAVQYVLNPKANDTQDAVDILNKEFDTAGIDVELSADEMIARETQSEIQQMNAEGGAPHPARLPKDDAYTSQQVENEMDTTTYYNDIVKTINTASAQDMAGMLRDERERERITKHNRKSRTSNWVYVLLGILLLGLAGYVAVRAFVFGQTPLSVPFIQSSEQQLRYASLIPVDRETTIQITDNVFDNRENVLLRVRNSYFDDEGKLDQIIPIDAESSQRMTLGTLMARFEVMLPESMNLAMDPDWMWGRLGGFDNYYFIYQKIGSFDRAFQGTREWERNMIKDLEEVLNIPDDVKQPRLYDFGFVDEVYESIPVRVLYAPRVTVREDIELVETRLSQERDRHTLPASTLNAIRLITGTEIIFSQADPFLEKLSVGDIIVASPSIKNDAFIREVNDISLQNGELVVSVSDVDPAELSPEAPEGAQVKRTVDPETGEVVYLSQEQKITKSYDEGEPVRILMYGFISDTELLIATHPDVFQSIIEAQSKDARE